jgi:hypothetical protein
LRKDGVLNRADQYRTIALELSARAQGERTFELASQWEHLAKCYLRLAAQADQNGLTDIAIEIGPKPKLDDDA